MRTSFWALNGGLAWMVLLNLFPIGALQLYDALANGYWHARSPAFFATPAVHVFEWLRLVGDTVFIVLGILPLVYLAFRMVRCRDRAGELPVDAVTEPLTQAS
jgi:nitric oxide reductase subunit B